MVTYRFEDSRGGDCFARHLAGYCGILQADGYTAYNRLAKAENATDAVIPAGCWGHVSRKFFELHVDESSPFATRTVEAMAPLWQIEEHIRGQGLDQRHTVRQERSVAIVHESL
ncbi:MAG: hypothetical protein CL535_24980 [Ahrensia sp.]|jgi:hypothetical protein|nr:hypothetical protein [Ahrensia sp.]|tara:strand:- start:2444 stop:2785 length:342 start_codon:yes stop_codon:yes gene_type:complete